MGALDWGTAEQHGRGWKLEVPVYETPYGSAIAAVTLEPSPYSSPDAEWRCSLMVDDPYIGKRFWVAHERNAAIWNAERLGYSCTAEEYARILAEEEYARASQKMGCREVEQAYLDSLREKAEEYVRNEVGAEIEDAYEYDDRTVEMRILEGGYEPARVLLSYDADGNVEMFYK